MRCYCIYTYEDGICVCVCDYPMTLPAFAERKPNPVTAMVDLCIENVELADIAAALDHLTDADIFVPAARAKTNVSLHAHKMSIADALEKLGLMSVPGSAAQMAP